MRLRLEHLQLEVKRAIREERDTDALRKEVTRVLGPIMDTEVRLEDLAEAVNDRVAVLDGTGRGTRVGFKPSVLLRFAEHKDPRVRKMTARLLPERFIDRFSHDRNGSVRAAVARRLPITAVREMMKEFPKDHALRSIYRTRKKLQRLHEDGVPVPKQDEPLDIHGEERLGAAGKNCPGPELSEVWYAEKARQLVQDYSCDPHRIMSIERNWEGPAVKGFCRHTRATSGVEIDEQKLLGAVKDLLDEKDDRAMERNELKEIAAQLREEADQEALNESAAAPAYDNVDLVQVLADSTLSPQNFIEHVNELFKVQEAYTPAGLGKYRMGEGSESTRVPMKAWLPHTHGLRPLDEKVLDRYVKCWNERQELTGEPLKLEWTIHPIDVDAIGFSAMLR